MGFDTAKFRVFRERFGSREKFADVLGVTGTTIQNWETGKAVPNINDISKASEILGVTVSELLGEYEPKRFTAHIPNPESDTDAMFELLRQKAKLIVEERELLKKEREAVEEQIKLLEGKNNST